jgi:hypothetical protein
VGTAAVGVGTTGVAVAGWVAGGSVAGVTGVEEGGTNVAVALGAALLQAVSSRIRKRKVSFFILSIVQTNVLLVNPPLERSFYSTSMDLLCITTT